MSPRRPLRRRALPAATLLLALLATARAAPLVHEPFDYAPGNLAGNDGGSGFAGAWGATRNNPTVSSPDKGWGLLSSAGGHARGGTWSGVARPLGSTLADAGLMADGAALWFSAVMDLEGQNIANADLNLALGTSGFVASAFGDRENLESGEGIGVSHSRALIQGVYWQNADADAVSERAENDSATLIDGLNGNGTRALIVGKVEWGADASAGEKLTLYAPGAGLNMGMPTMAEWTTPALDQSGFDTLALQFKDQAQFDEIRFGASFADVAPAVPLAEVVLAATDFDGRTRSTTTSTNDTAGGLNWTTGGVATPGDLTAVPDEELGNGFGQFQANGLFQTANTQNAFVPDLNIHNEGTYYVDIPLRATASGVYLSHVTFTGIITNNSGDFQPLALDVDYRTEVLDPAGAVLSSDPSSGQNAFFSGGPFPTVAVSLGLGRVALAPGQNYTVRLYVGADTRSGNNAGFDDLVIWGSEPALRITEFSHDPGEATVDLTFISIPGTEYAIESSTDGKNWTGASGTAVLAGAGTTTKVGGLALPTPVPDTLLLRVLRPVAFMEMVSVGNPGNAADTEGDPNPAGAVAYEYSIGKYEVTNAQYAAFLDAVAATDPNALYSESMGSSARGGITRSGADGSYTYGVKADMSDKPVVYVSWYDALRFCNWLHNGRPSGAQSAGTTEGGAYTFSGPEVVTTPRNAGARYWLPSEDEWYKAAYHEPGASGNDFWRYPTRSDDAPTAEAPPGGANSANFDFAVGSHTDVGGYANTRSFYGAFDMGGNVWEWNETEVFGGRGLRGGSWLNNSFELRSSNRFDDHPSSVDSLNGFRVAGA